MKKEELENIYKEVLQYANHCEQHEMIKMLYLETTLAKQLKHFDELKDDPEWQKLLERNKNVLIKYGYIKGK